MTKTTGARSPLRTILARAGVVALAAATAAALTACGSSGSSGGQGGGGAKSTSLTIGYDHDAAAQGYDPLRYSSGQRLLFESMYDSLFVQQADGSVAPGLVKEFTYNADKTELTLTLKDGVTFTDGSKLSADLVKKNLDRRTDKDLQSYGAFAPKGAAEITTVTAKDASTVVLAFAAPQGTFESQLAGEAGMIVGEQGAADSKSLATTPDGSGPYTLDTAKTVKGSAYVVNRKDGVDAAKYPYQTLTYKVITDKTARANAVISGQVDVAIIDGSTADLVKSRGTGLAKNGGTVLEMPFFDKLGTTAKAVGDKRVRLAMNYAIDRQSLVDALYKGARPTANAFPEASKGYDPALDTTYAYNPEKAKQLLADAGYPTGFEFNVTTSPDAKTVMEAFQKMFEAVGIKMNIKVTTSTDEIFAAVATQPIGYLPLGWANEVGVTAGVLVGGFANVQHAENPVIGAALGKASNAKGDGQAAALKELNHALVDEGWIIPIAEQYSYIGYNTKKVAEPKFPGLDGIPLLTTLQPAG
jgi:peptide/nickel transport system substrate-binding protein